MYQYQVKKRSQPAFNRCFDQFADRADIRPALQLGFELRHHRAHGSHASGVAGGNRRIHHGHSVQLR